MCDKWSLVIIFQWSRGILQFIFQKPAASVMKAACVSKYQSLSKYKVEKEKQKKPWKRDESCMMSVGSYYV